jgi:signal transduction histidine kinase
VGWFDPGAPHAYRGPFTRWPRIADGALALLVFAGSLASVTLSALGDGEDYTFDAITDLSGAAVALLAVAAVALLWRRRQPIAVAAAVTATMVVWAIAGYGDGNDLALIAATYAVGRYAHEPLHNAAVLGGAIALSVLGTIIDANQRIDVAPAIILPVLAWYVGRRVRNRGDYLTLLRERSERLEADQQARARQAVANERSRIARELHDVVAHQVSMMTVQAGAAKTIARTDLDTAIDSMGDVEQAGRQALGELRHLLGVLRADGTDPGDLGPQPRLADLPNLVDHLTNTGAAVTLTLALDQRDDIPASVELSAYRIIQESITNIIKHAGPNATVDIAVEADRRELVIEITNTTDGNTPQLPRSGYGIAGMQERANLLGGTLTAEPVPPDRFRVLAHLPLEPEKT